MSESLVWLLLIGGFFFLMHRGGKHGTGCCGGHDHGSQDKHLHGTESNEQSSHRHH